MEKIVFITFLCVFIIILFMPLEGNAANDNVIRVFIDNEEINFAESDGTPFLDTNGRTQVPLRKTMETVGIAVSYDNNERSVLLSGDETSIKLIIDNPLVSVGESVFRLDTAPIIIKSRTYVPLRFILEQFGYTVEWDNALRSVRIAKILNGGLKWSEPGSTSMQGFETPLGFDTTFLFPVEIPLYEISSLPFTSVGFVNNSHSNIEIREAINIIYEIHKINPNGDDELITRFVFDSFSGELPAETATWLRIPYLGQEASKGQFRITMAFTAPIVYYVDGEIKSNILEEIARYGVFENTITVI
jgi:hypothetical protein